MRIAREAALSFIAVGLSVMLKAAAGRVRMPNVNAAGWLWSMEGQVLSGARLAT